MEINSTESKFQKALNKIDSLEMQLLAIQSIVLRLDELQLTSDDILILINRCLNSCQEEI